MPANTLYSAIRRKTGAKDKEGHFKHTVRGASVHAVRPSPPPSVA